MTMTLPVGSVLYLDTSLTDTPTWVKLSEHNRSPISIDTERIEKTQRMSGGTLRKVWIADKKTINTSWSMLPTNDAMTVDGGYGEASIRTFYHGDKGKNTFKVKISYNGVAARDEILLMSFTSCSFTVVKRNVKEKTADSPQEFWDVSIGLEEV
jgi:hypothetical protein